MRVARRVTSRAVDGCISLVGGVVVVLVDWEWVVGLVRGVAELVCCRWASSSSLGRMSLWAKELIVWNEKRQQLYLTKSWKERLKKWKASSSSTRPASIFVIEPLCFIDHRGPFNGCLLSILQW